jgi:GntR family transcriptional regulator
LITRLRLGNGRPIAIQTASLPAARFDGLERINLADTSLYEVLDDIYGVVPTSAEETFTVAPMMQPNAQLLQVEDGAPGFYLERITFVATIPFEFVSAFIRGDGYRIRLTLRPTPGMIKRRDRSGV